MHEPVKRVHVSSMSELEEYARKGHRIRASGGFTPEFDLEAGIAALHNPGDNPAYVEQARTMLDKLMLDLPSTRREFASSVVGAFPNAGAFASGEPECMWMPYATEDEYQPIRILVNLNMSGAIADKPDLIIKRGVALTALIIALSERRSVSLQCFNTYVKVGTKIGADRHGGAIVSWNVPTAPLVLAQIVTHLIDPNVTRNIALSASVGFANPNHYNGTGWLNGHLPGQVDHDQMRVDLAANADDIIIPGLFLHDPMLADPLQWLNDKINAALKGRDE